MKQEWTKEKLEKKVVDFYVNKLLSSSNISKLLHIESKKILIILEKNGYDSLKREELRLKKISKKNKGKKRTKEQREHLSEINKGKILTEETKAKIKKSCQGMHIGENNPMYRTSLVPWNKNKTYKWSEKAREKNKNSIYYFKSGEKHPNWKNNISKLYYDIRNTTKFLHWKNKVLERDNYTCQDCNSKTKIETHHKILLSDLVFCNKIKTKKEAIDCSELWDISDGAALCKKCHDEISSMWSPIKLNDLKNNQNKVIKKIRFFEEYIAKLYDKQYIKFPIHLSGSNSGAQERFLINFFKQITKEDTIFSTWRNHYSWLLSGRNPLELKYQIMNHGSMHVFDKKFFTSAIVGGIPSIAMGVAWALKRKKSKNKVFCFIGDSGASCGISIESMRYACGHKLPIKFIIEDNGLSVYTNVQEAFGCKECKNKNCHLIGKKIEYYNYCRRYKHHGTRLEKDKNEKLF